jgi:glycosyltransferase involved in cell wall biosynthesis
MDVFGYPLRSDHYGTCEQVIGEAMASGLSVVCMDNPCERTIIEEGVAGFLCKDEQEYIDNIEHLYYKPELRNFMGKNSRQAAVGIYNIKNMITAWDATFKDIMQKPKKERKPVI